MLLAIQSHFRTKDPTPHLAISQHSADYDWRCRHGLYHYLDIEKVGRSWLGSLLLPASFRKAFGLLKFSEIDVLLDASGFAFGDLHPESRTLQFAALVRRAKRRGQKVILMPQAFGPFKNPRLREPMTRILHQADLIFARDQDSLEHLQNLSPIKENVYLAPDFTIGIKGTGRITPQISEPTVLIVPNARMLDKPPQNQASAYIDVLARCIKLVRTQDAIPKLLIHDAIEDRHLVPMIQEHLDSSIEVIEESDPLILKKRISDCALLIGSRFHALVGALSQSIPAIGFGWSHKYERLFEDFDCAEFAMTVTASDKTLEETITHLLSLDAANPIGTRIRAAAKRQMAQTDAMWEKIDKTIE